MIEIFALLVAVILGIGIFMSSKMLDKTDYKDEHEDEAI